MRDRWHTRNGDAIAVHHQIAAAAEDVEDNYRHPVGVVPSRPAVFPLVGVEERCDGNADLRIDSLS